MEEKGEQLSVASFFPYTLASGTFMFWVGMDSYFSSFSWTGSTGSYGFVFIFSVSGQN